MYKQNFLLMCKHFYVSAVYNLFCVELNVMNYDYNLDGWGGGAVVALAPPRVG